MSIENDANKDKAPWERHVDLKGLIIRSKPNGLSIANWIWFLPMLSPACQDSQLIEYPLRQSSSTR